MSYRTIQVDGVDYEWTCGSAMVRVKGVGEAYREQVGEQVGIDDIQKTMVTPRHVAAWIRTQTAAPKPRAKRKA